MKTRTAGVVGAIGAVASAAAAILVTVVVTPASAIPADRWSYPWSADALVSVSIVYAVLHLLVLLGLLGLTTAAAGRVGGWIAVAGTAVLVVAELLSIPIAGQRLDQTAPGLVGATFGLGTAVSAVGFLTAGVAIVRARATTGWRRYVLLATGIWTVAMLGLVNTPALSVAVGIYGLLLTAVFLAMATAPAAPGSLVGQPTSFLDRARN